MGKLYAPSKAGTPIDRVRQLISWAEVDVSNLGGDGQGTLRLLHEFDQIEDDLSQLEQHDVDVRVERTNFEALQRQLDDRKRRFLREAGRMLQEERARLKPARSRRWWYLDEADVETAIELDPGSGWTYYLRAGVAVRRGDREAALMDLDQAVTFARENGDGQLKALASTQRAGVMNSVVAVTATP